MELYKYFQPTFYKKQGVTDHGNALSLFQEATFDDRCEDAGLISVIVYLKGCNGLRIPEAWKPLIPKQL